MSFPRYPKYKDSGVEWLGDVPEEWEVLPVRVITSHIDRRNEGAICQDYLSLMANIGVIPYEDKGDIGNKKPEDLSKCKMVEIGDIVINSMNYNIGSYGMSAYRGVCSPVYGFNEAAVNSPRKQGLEKLKASPVVGIAMRPRYTGKRKLRNLR